MNEFFLCALSTFITFLTFHETLIFMFPSVAESIAAEVTLEGNILKTSEVRRRTFGSTVTLHAVSQLAHVSSVFLSLLFV